MRKGRGKIADQCLLHWWRLGQRGQPVDAGPHADAMQVEDQQFVEVEMVAPVEHPGMHSSRAAGLL